MKSPALTCLVLLASGCLTPLTGSMRAVSRPLVLQPDPATARVVFVRAEHLRDHNLSIFFFDGPRGRVLGKSVNGSAFAVDLEPGDYLLCGAPVFEQTSLRLTPELARWPPSGWSSFQAPVTRLSVAAGRTYLLEATVASGALEARPVRPGTSREQRLLATLHEVRAAEPVAESDEFKQFADASLLKDWFEHCLASSSDDLRLRLVADEGRTTPAEQP